MRERGGGEEGSILGSVTFEPNKTPSKVALPFAVAIIVGVCAILFSTLGSSLLVARISFIISIFKTH
jgi:hypothetical protein